MNSFLKPIVRKLTGGLQVLSKRHVSAGTYVPSFTSCKEPLIKHENGIAQLVQRNIIPLTDVLPKITILDRPRTNVVKKIDTPVLQKIDIEPRKIIHDPNVGTEKMAHTMLRRKRKKMNRHRYLKRQRKLRFVYMRIRRVRYAKQENKFRAEIAMKLKECESFDAVQYVNSRLEKYRQVVLPNRIKGGVRMPPFVIKEVLEKKQKLKEEYSSAKRRKEIFKAEMGGTLNVKD